MAKVIAFPRKRREWKRADLPPRPAPRHRRYQVSVWINNRGDVAALFMQMFGRDLLARKACTQTSKN